MLARIVLDGIEIPANMVAIIVRPVAVESFFRMKREDVDVGETHEVYAEDLYAVI